MTSDGTSRLRWHITMSLDGFVAAPDGSISARGVDFGLELGQLDDILGRIGAVLIGHRTYHGDDGGRRAKTEKGGGYGGTWKGPHFVYSRDDPGTAAPGFTFIGGPIDGLALDSGTGLAFMVGISDWLRLAGERTRAQARTREKEDRRRASEERVCMARDLHDVVAHNIAVINVQANTALHLMDRQPDRARTALSTINDVSKQALVELRSVLGVLRSDDGGGPRAPVATLGELERLVENTRATGLEVRLEQVGSARPLPVEVDLAAYRVVQEALTNSARHSEGRQALVRVCYRPSHLVVEVTDDGRAPSGSHPPGGPGNGITGMTERVTALGGALETGPMANRGFRVRACIPTNGGGAAG